MTKPLSQIFKAGGRLPVIGELLRKQRQEFERRLAQLVDVDAISARLNSETLVGRPDIGQLVGQIVARIDIGEIVSKLPIDEIVSRLDLDALVSRLDLDALVSRMDIDAVVSRLDLDDLIARMDMARLMGKVVEDVDPMRMLKQAGSSMVRGRRPQEQPPDE
jgi:hypothetical protein